MITVASELVVAAQYLAVVAEDPDGNIITRDTVSPGGIGFILFALLGIGTFLLWLSMNKQLKRIEIPEDRPRVIFAAEVTDSSADDVSPSRGPDETPEH